MRTDCQSNCRPLEKMSSIISQFFSIFLSPYKTKPVIGSVLEFNGKKKKFSSITKVNSTVFFIALEFNFIKFSLVS
jgi:hypothetical protein